MKVTTDEQILDDLTRHLLKKMGRNIQDYIQLCQIAELPPGDVMPKLVHMLIRLTAHTAINEYIEADERGVIAVLQHHMEKARAELPKEQED
jgi:hypothetical protein